MNRKHATLLDTSLRDGNHALHHQLGIDDVMKYTKIANECGIDIIEVGHGNGLGASSMQVGLSRYSDRELLTAAKKNLTNSKLAALVLPGFACFEDIDGAIDIGVDIFRIATHSTEASLSKSYIEKIKKYNKTVYGCLMMCHMADTDTLKNEAMKMKSYGVDVLYLFDSAGSMLPQEVYEKIFSIKECTDLEMGFHAHDNLGLSVANSIAAVEAGATFLDSSIKGFGAGAGNTHLELLVAVLKKMDIVVNADLNKLFELGDYLEDYISNELPFSKSINIMSAYYGVFSGFSKHIQRISKQYDVNIQRIFEELGKRKVIGGQEDIIVEVASMIKQEEKYGK